MGEHKITIEIISNPENNVLQTQLYVTKIRPIFAYFTQYEQVNN